jgi:SAM-dependent methyltransferase
MEVVSALYKDEGKIREAFRSGEGLAWAAHDHDLFHGVERMFKAGYIGNLVSSWIPALDGVDAKLRGGPTSIADVGCGHGASTVLLAKAYPEASIVGFDVHEPSIAAARERAEEAGVADRVHFQVASAQDFPGSDYDLVCIFDALHDMGDPVGAARHIRDAMAASGTWLLVEPAAGDDVLANVNPVGRAFYSGSIGICTPCAQAQPGGYALGNQVPDARWRELLVDDAGFAHFRRATETPFNRVFEVRK